MAFTKLYLTTLAAPYTPATIRGAWDDSGGAVTKALSPHKTGGGVITSVSRAETNVSTTYDVLLYRGISGKLAAQTINCNLDLVLGILEANADADFFWHVHIYVTQGDSDTPRGDLLTDYIENTTNEWPTTATGQVLQAAQATASLAISDGDRIVVEIGYIARNSHTTSRAGTLNYGTQVSGGTLAEASDLTNGSSSVSSLAGYISFDASISEFPQPTRLSQLVVEPISEGAHQTRLSQIVIESVTPDGTSPQRISQLITEPVNTGASSQLISQLAVEVVYTPPPFQFTLRGAWKGIEGPVYFSEFAHFNVSGAVEVLPWSPITMADRNDWHYGLKRAIMLSVGDISIPLSDRFGRLQIPTCEVTYSDTPDRMGSMPLRAMLDNTFQDTMRGSEYTLYAYTDEARRLQIEPTIVFRGFADRYKCPADYEFSLLSKGWIARRFKQKLWDDVISDLFVQAPAVNLELSVPVAIGELSDEPEDSLAAVAGPLQFVEDEAGRNGAGEPTPVSSWGTIGVAAPTGFAMSEGVGNIDYTTQMQNNKIVGFVRRIHTGTEGDPNYFLPSDQIAGELLLTGDNKSVHMECDDTVPGDTYRFYMAWDFSGVRVVQTIDTTDPVTGVDFTEMNAPGVGSPLSPGASPAGELNASVTAIAVMSDGSRTAASTVAFVATNGGQMRPSRLCVTPLAGAVGYEFYMNFGSALLRFDNDGSVVNTNSDVLWEWDWASVTYTIVESIPVPEGVIPPIHCGQVTDLLGGVWEAFLISGRPCWSYQSAFVNGDRVDDTEYSGVYTAQIAARGMGDYDSLFANPFVTGPYTPEMVFLRGALATSVLVDQETFKVNVQGEPNEDIDDVETDGFEQIKILLKNIVLADTHGIELTWDQNPFFTDGTPRLDEATVTQAQADAADVFSSATRSRWLPGSLTVDQLFQDVCPGLKMKLGIKPNGQIVACVHNPSASSAFTIKEQREILEKSFSFEGTDQGFANVIDYECTPEYSNTGAIASMIDTGTRTDSTSITKHKGERAKEATTFRYNWIRSTAIADEVTDAHLVESAYLPRPMQAESGLHWVHFHPGQVGDVTHRQGATAIGYVGRKHAILGMKISLEDCRVSLTALDLKVDV